MIEQRDKQQWMIYSIWIIHSWLFKAIERDNKGVGIE